jgi:AraC-like DNA-binding protein
MHEKKLFTDENFSLRKMSDLLGVTVHQLSRIINEKTGTNFRVYLNSYRVKEAMVLLCEKPDLSIIEVAFAIGFNSKSSFNDAFLKSTGLTPRSYRSGNQKK